MSRPSTPVQIGTRYYDIDISRMQRKPLSSLRQMVDQGEQPSEQSFDNQGQWKRISDDFVYGAGQVYFDQFDESNRRRHRTSKGFEMLSDRRTLQTQPQFQITDITGLTLSGSYRKLARTDTNYWVGSDSGLVRSTGLDGFVGSVNITGEPGSGFRDMASFNNTIYAAYNTNGIYTGSATGGSIALLAAVNCDRIAVAHGRLIGAYGSEVFEISAAGVKTSIYTHPETATFKWYGICAGSAGIYIAGSSVLKSEIHLIGVVDSTGALAPPYPVAELPPGEIVNKIIFFGGFLVIASNRGVRIARSAASGYLEYGPIMTDFGNVAGVVTDGRYCFITCDDLPYLGGAGIIKLDLSRFSAPLTPSWCVEHWLVPAFGYGGDPGDWTVDDVGTHFTGGTSKVTAWVKNNSLGEHSLYMTSWDGHTSVGEFWSGLVTYGTPERKAVLSAEAVWDPLPDGASVTLELWDKYGGTMYGSTVNASAGSIGDRVYPSVPLESETVELRIIARPTDSSGHVKVRRWTIRGLPMPFKAEEILLPIMLSRRTDGSGSVASIDALDEWAYLKGLEQARTRVDFQFGNVSSRAYVDAVIVDPSAGGFVTWDQDGSWPDGMIVVRLITVEDGI